MTARRRAFGCAALLAALLQAAPARADPAAPFSSPQCDVDILYAVPLPEVPVGPGTDKDQTGARPAEGAVTQRLRVQAATGLQRLDPPSAGAFMLTDGRTGQTIVVEPSLKLATVLPTSGAITPPPGVRATGTYQRLGNAVVAGNGCTDWHTGDLAGRASVVCLTEDGLMLRIVQDGQVRAQAVQVRRAPQPDALFAVPVEDRRVQAPASPGPVAQRRG